MKLVSICSSVNSSLLVNLESNNNRLIALIDIRRSAAKPYCGSAFAGPGLGVCPIVADFAEALAADRVVCGLGGMLPDLRSMAGCVVYSLWGQVRVIAS